jgi:hypothetical protein
MAQRRGPKTSPFFTASNTEKRKMTQTTTTINPGLPSANSGLSSEVIRDNFAAAANDVNYLLEAVNGSSSAPALAYAATGAPAVRLASDRANDFVRLDDYIPVGVGMGRKDAIAGARTALLAKAPGGRILIGYGDLNLGTGVLVENQDGIVWEGEGFGTRIISSATTGPIVSLGDNTRLCSHSNLQHFRVVPSATVSGPVVRAVRCNEGLIRDVEVDNNATYAYLIDGGTGNYNTRLKSAKAYGTYSNGLIVGGPAGQVSGFYCDEDFSFGGCTSAGILLVSVSGCSIDVGEVLSSAQGITTFPGAGQIVNAVQLGARIQLDTCTGENVAILDGGGNVSNIVSTGLWACSEQGTGSAARVHVAGSGSTNVQGIRFQGAIIGNGASTGVLLTNCDDVAFVGCVVNGNGTTVAGSANYFIGDGSNHVFISGSARGQFTKYAPFNAVTTPFGIQISASTDYITTNYVDTSGCATGIQNSSTGTHNHILT